MRPYGRHGRIVSFAVAGTVVDDSAELAVVATTPGSDVVYRSGPGSGPRGRLVLPDDWDGTYLTRAWQGTTVVRVHRWSEPWSVWRWHDGQAWSDGWYGNLETPWRRTPIGYDSEDWILDVVAEGVPGTPSWRVGFKDEDELDFLVAAGARSQDDANLATATGQRLAAVAARADWPFDADWDAWLPDPAWSPVTLPAGWEQPTGA